MTCEQSLQPPIAHEPPGSFGPTTRPPCLAGELQRVPLSISLNGQDSLDASGLRYSYFTNAPVLIVKPQGGPVLIYPNVHRTCGPGPLRGPWRQFSSDEGVYGSVPTQSARRLSAQPLEDSLVRAIRDAGALLGDWKRRYL